MWRAKQIAGTLTDDELREAIVALREARKSAVPTATKRKSTPAPNSEDLLNQFL
jgi:hypothetical protein